MILYWISIPISLASLAVIGVTLARHWREIRLLDPDSIQEERVRQKRRAIIDQRFVRLAQNKIGPMRAVFKNIFQVLEGTYRAAHLKLVQLDRFYKQTKSPIASAAPSTKERIKVLLDEARSLARDLKWADAERRFVEALSVDNRNVDAYKGLGIIYLKQKMLPQAKETFEFLIRLKKADDTSYAGLAEIAEAEGDLATALAMHQKAVEVRPRLACRHAELAAFLASREEFDKAWAAAKKAVELEPKSAKYTELCVDIAICLGNRDEAKRCYEKLRLLMDDRQRLQTIKERIDEMAS